MEQVMMILGKYGPQYILIALAILALWKSGALKAIFAKNGDRYVLKEHCHLHIDGMNKNISELKTDLKDYIKDVDKKVDMLLEAKLKRG